MLDDLLALPLALPLSMQTVLERWSRAYLASQAPLPREPARDYRFNVLSGRAGAA